MDENSLKINPDVSSVVSEIRSVIDAARNNVARQVNTELLSTYWDIGRIVCEYEQTLPERADYGKQTLQLLSKELTKELGKGFSRANLYNMRLFYLTYKKFQSVTGKLTWTHYCELLSISDPDKRSFYEKESINSGWSVRRMKPRKPIEKTPGAWRRHQRFQRYGSIHAVYYIHALSSPFIHHGGNQNE